MNESASPLKPIACDRCEAACGADDNFCRQCGLSLRVSANLPSVRPKLLPAIRQPTVPAVVVRGAAFVAAGKIAEIVARRMVRNVLNRGNGNSKSLTKAQEAEVVSANEPTEAIISETLVTRRIFFRR